MCIELELPLPPTLNQYRVPVVKKGKNGKPYATLVTSKEGKAYKSGLREYITKIHNISHNVHVSIILYPKTKRLIDIDNYLKCLFDGLTENNVWLDDSQVVSMYVERGEPVKGGKLYIKISKK